MDRTHRFAIALALNAGLVIVQAGFAAAAHSTGLLADAGHNLVDVGGLALHWSLSRLALVLRVPPARTDRPRRPSSPRWADTRRSSRW